MNLPHFYLLCVSPEWFSLALTNLIWDYKPAHYHTLILLLYCSVDSACSPFPLHWSLSPLPIQCLVSPLSLKSIVMFNNQEPCHGILLNGNVLDFFFNSVIIEYYYCGLLLRTLGNLCAWNWKIGTHILALLLMSCNSSWENVEGPRDTFFSHFP